MEYTKKKGWDMSTSLGMNNFPFDALSLNTKNMGFVIASYNNSKEYIKAKKLEKYAKKYDGFTIKDDNGVFVLYSDNLNYAGRNKVIMHEVGHVVMGHTSYNNILGHSADKAIENAQEKEANLFAISFLAPVPKLISLGITDALDISRLTGLSMTDSDLVAADVQREKQIILLEKAKQIKKVAIITICLALSIVSACILWVSSKNTTAPTDIIAPDLPSAHQGTNPPDTSSTVYITKTGEKYHLEECQYIKGNGITIFLEDAKENGYLPCKVCKPLT